MNAQGPLQYSPDVLYSSFPNYPQHIRFLHGFVPSLGKGTFLCCVVLQGWDANVAVARYCAIRPLLAFLQQRAGPENSRAKNATPTSWGSEVVDLPSCSDFLVRMEAGGARIQCATGWIGMFV